MNSVLKKYILPVFIVGIIALFCGWGTYKNYTSTENKIHERIEKLFDKAIYLDKDVRMTETPFFYSCKVDTRYSDSIRVESEESAYSVKKTDEFKQKALEERLSISVQMYMMKINPLRVACLDSLFRQELHKNQIPAETAVSYEAKGKRHFSSSDSSFYASAWKMDEVVIGFERDMVLQGYVKLPVYYIIAESFPAYFFVLILCCVGIGWLWTWKRNRRVVILPTNNVTREVVLLRDDLAYDKEHGVLIYKGQEIHITNYKLDMFNVLLESKGQYVSSDTLQSVLWPDGLSTKDALMQTVKRLRKDLEIVLGLKIENLRGNGYRLLIEQPVTEESH